MYVVCPRISHFAVFTTLTSTNLIHHTKWGARASRSTPAVFVTRNISKQEFRGQISYMIQKFSDQLAERAKTN